MRLIDADKLTPIIAPIAGITTGELTHYEKIVFWKTIYDAPTVNVIDWVLEIIDDADKKAGDKTYILLDDGSFYSQAKYIKEKMLELLEE